MKVATTYWSLTVGGDPLLPYTSRLFYYISIYIYIFFFFFLFTIGALWCKISNHESASLPIRYKCYSDIFLHIMLGIIVFPLYPKY